MRVLTVFVTEHRTGEDRAVDLSFALDTLGADLPHLIRHELVLKEDSKVEVYLDIVAPRIDVEPAVPDSNPLRALLRVTINAILYATSAGIDPQVRASPTDATRNRGRVDAPVRYSSDAVYFLPGAIEISQLRRMQELDRIPDGRAITRRFMVRGHWRRAASSWADQRLRWVQPYWKGPDMATMHRADVQAQALETYRRWRRMRPIAWPVESRGVYGAPEKHSGFRLARDGTPI